MTAAERLIQHYGDRHKAATALGLNKETIRLWLERGIPLGKAVEVERRCGGIVTAEQILREAKSRNRTVAA